MTTTRCEHENFRSTVEVNRLVNGQQVSFMADVKVSLGPLRQVLATRGCPQDLGWKRRRGGSELTEANVLKRYKGIDS